MDTDVDMASCTVRGAGDGAGDGGGTAPVPAAVASPCAAATSARGGSAPALADGSVPSGALTGDGGGAGGGQRGKPAACGSDCVCAAGLGRSLGLDSSMPAAHAVLVEQVLAGIEQVGRRTCRTAREFMFGARMHQHMHQRRRTTCAAFSVREAWQPYTVGCVPRDACCAVVPSHTCSCHSCGERVSR